MKNILIPQLILSKEKNDLPYIRNLPQIQNETESFTENFLNSSQKV